MRNVRLTLIAAALFAAACGSNPPPRVAPAAKPQRPAIAGAAEPPRREVPIAAPVVDLGIPVPDHPAVRSALALFTTRMRSGVQDSLTRSAQYKEMIDRIFAEYDLPRALTYLPVIESAYSPTLISRAGARGIWQFMSPTAREYGLQVDGIVDQRSDAERSTRAAAVYIRDLYRQFNDWPLTLAAYNAGASRVRRAMKSAGATSYWDLRAANALPSETREYVPYFFAAISIVGAPSSYGFRLGDAGPRDEQRIEIEGPVSLRSIAQAANIDEEKLCKLNPAYYRRIVPAGRWNITVPASVADVVVARAPALKNDDATFAELSEPPIPSAPEKGGLLARPQEIAVDAAPMRREYEVQKGDTMYSIAKRFELTVDQLRGINGLSPDHILHPGERLLVAAARPASAGGI